MRDRKTVWNTEKLFLRKKFKINKKETGNLALRIHHDGPAKVYLNSELIYENENPDYRILNIEKRFIDKLLDGNNIIAVETSSGRRGRFFDIALFDIKKDVADDILYSPGQPNILRGPNGFEWWLIYMANKNRELRGQYINRLHFFGKTMYAEGVTSSNTKGYFPEPAKPTYGERFDNENFINSWLFPSEKWKIEDGEFIPLSETSKALLNNKFKAQHYYFEAGINTSSEAGIIAWHKDDNNQMRIGLNEKENKWYYRIIKNGNVTEHSFPLFDDFRFGVYHSITVERNQNLFTVRIDDLAAPGISVIKTDIFDDGVPGLYSDKGKSAFDGITYTIGWDEFGDKITNWGNAKSGDKATDNFNISESGIKITNNNQFFAYKGDMLSAYEFSVQITNEDDSGTAGIYPVYIDKNNFVKAGFNYDTQKLEISAVKKGKKVFDEKYSLEQLTTMFADVKYTDMIEKGYSFNSPTWINEIWLERKTFGNRDLFVDNMFDKMTVEYLYDGKWHSFPQSETKVAPHPLYNQMTFNPARVERLRFINKEPRDQARHIYKIRVNEKFKESYNIRTVKQEDKVLIFVNGKEICSVNIDFPAAQSGIFADGCALVFNGILWYHLPK